MVLVHGVGLNADAWAGMAPTLASDHHVHAVDMPGHGGSKPLPANPALSDYSAMLIQAIEEIGGPCTVVGHSMGAMIALDIGARRPDLCSGVVALNAIYQRSEAASIAVKKRAASLPEDRVADPTPTLKRWFGDDLDQPDAKACRQWLTGVDPSAYKQAYTVFAEEDGPSVETLRAITCPALFMTGSEEPNSTPAMSRAMAGIVPKGTVRIIENAAHMMPMTHADEVSGHLIDFLTSVMGEAR